MDIILSGAQGTGKSLIARLLLEKIPDATLVPSVSSRTWDYYYENYGVDKSIHWSKLPLKDHDLYQLLAFQRSIDEFLGDPLYDDSPRIFDRSFVDVMAFTYKKHQAGLVSNAVMGMVRNHALKFVFNECDVINAKYFWLVPDPDYMIDNCNKKRVADTSDQLITHEAFYRVLSTLYMHPENTRPLEIPKYSIVPNGTIEEKVDWIIKETTKHDA